MAISFKEQIDNFSNDFYINTAYIPYIVNGPECADGLSADELKKIDDFLDKWSYVDCSEAMLDSPDFGECRICGMQAAVTKATFINKEAVREEEQRRGIVLKPEERTIDSNLSKPNKNDMER